MGYCEKVVQAAKDLDILVWESDLLRRFSQGSLLRLLQVFHTPTRERDLPPVIGKVIRAPCVKHVPLVALSVERNEDRGRPSFPLDSSFGLPPRQPFPQDFPQVIHCLTGVLIFRTEHSSTIAAYRLPGINPLDRIGSHESPAGFAGRREISHPSRRGLFSRGWLVAFWDACPEVFEGGCLKPSLLEFIKKSRDDHRCPLRFPAGGNERQPASQKRRAVLDLLGKDQPTPGLDVQLAGLRKPTRFSHPC